MYKVQYNESRANIEQALRMGDVCSLVVCEKHDAPIGQACFRHIQQTSNYYVFGICNSRAKKAGFNGEIDPKSLRRGFIK